MKKLKSSILVRLFLLIQCIILLSGCNKIIHWAEHNFKQADQHSQKIVDAVKPYIQTTIAYNQFATVANFDVLFLTDKVRMLYVDYYKAYHGLTKEEESLMVQRVLNENKYFISFYVVGAQAPNHYESNKSLFTGEYQKQTALLGDKESTWHLRLKIGFKEYLPDSIRVVDLPVEYQHFFGTSYSQFKSVYLVRFDARDMMGNVLLKSNERYLLSLDFYSSLFKTNVEWKQCLYSKE